MVFSEQQDLLSELLTDPNTSADDAFPLAKRKAALNRGEIHFAKDSFCVKEYATGVIATLKLDVPANWIQTFCLIIDDDVIDNKREVALHDWERYHDNGSVEPFYYLWTFSGTKSMRFLAGSGLNGKTYKLFYFVKPTTALDLDANESIIPDEYREASAYWAAHRLLKAIGQNTRAAEAKGEYDRMVVEAQIQFGVEHIKKTYPEPDLGDGEVQSTTDRQGGPGW